MNRLVLGFDSWVGGVHNFKRLQPALESLGFEFRLLHIGSWGGDPDRPAEEYFGDFQVRDISYYDGLNVYDVLAQEKPCAVLFLSNDVFAHRAVNRFCRLLRIPTLHIYHGLVGVQSLEKTQIYKVNPIRQFYYVMERIPKALMHIWPLYFSALHKSHAPLSDWVRFVSDCFNLAAGKYIAVAAKDSQTNGCCIYTRADKAHAKGKYGYCDEAIHVVGNPDLEKFGLSAEKIGVRLRSSTRVAKTIVYIDTGLIFTGMVFEGEKDFLSHLRSLKLELESQGLSLAIKLHPDHQRTSMPQRLAEIGIRVVNSDEFVEVLSKSSAAMVEPSTAALIPALMGVPLLLASFGKLAGQEYGDTLISYPRSSVVDDPAQIGQLLKSTYFDDINATESWISENSGPLPASEMPARVAAVVKRVVEH